MSYYGGWIPSTYFTDDIPRTVYTSKAGREYMNFKSWGEEHYPNQDDRDEAMKKIYLSAKMMKWHPLMTKALRKTYSLMAAAALKEMSPRAKFEVKRESNQKNTALKELRYKMKTTKQQYGPINKRGLYNKIDFWNRLIDLDINDEDQEKINIMLSGYEPRTLTTVDDYAYDNGLIGANDTYEKYKDALEAQRERARQRMLLLKGCGTRRELGFGTRAES